MPRGGDHEPRGTRRTAYPGTPLPETPYTKPHTRYLIPDTPYPTPDTRYPPHLPPASSRTARSNPRTMVVRVPATMSA
ncbi:MAG TPA: hypothetical protein DEB06_00380 [Phycisphaerales bacterium]|nr:hypothetical protein [Phycisphaerales bacterium]